VGTAKAADQGSGDNRVRLLPVLIACTAVLLLPATGAAQSDESQNIEQLAEGQQIYSDNCSACHQPTGLGIPGSFPPLRDNPRVADDEYVRGVVTNGLSGPIEVNGETYDGVMPSFTTLDDAQIDAVIAFLQNGLVVPGDGAGPEDDDGGTTAGTTLPVFASTMASFAYLIAIAIALWVLAPRIIGVIDRGSVSRLDAALKGSLIVIYFAVTTVFLPSLLLSTEVMGRLPQGLQDFVATAVWAGALGIGVLGLWWFQRQDRI
jgi:mono/diheme cytochrome c family protein